MPTMHYKTTLLFRQSRQGWTESYYQFLEEANIENAMAKALVLVAMRSRILGSPAYVEAVRVHEHFAPYQTATRIINVSQTSVDKRPDYASATIVVRLQSGENASRTTFLRGYPDDWVFKDPTTDRMIVTEPGKTEIYAYLAGLVTNGWMFPGIDRVASAGLPNYILSMDSETGWLRLLLGAEPDEFIVGQRVRISGVKGKTSADSKKVNRTTYCRAAVGNEMVVSIKTADLAPLDTYTDGAVYELLTRFYPITNYSIVRPGARRAGRAFFVPPGRRSKRR